MTAFLDANVILYLLSLDRYYADKAENLMTEECVVSIQILNECALAMRRKLKLSWEKTDTILHKIVAICDVIPMTLSIHRTGISIAQRYGFHIYDAMIWAAAIEAGCETLYSEDMHHGQRIEGVTLINPFQ